MLLTNYIQFYLDLRANEWAPNTLKAYKDASKHLNMIGDRDIALMGIEEFYLVKKSMLNSNLSIETIKLTLSLLRSIIDFAYKAGRRNQPAPNIREIVQRSKNDKKQIEEPFSVEELKQVIACLPSAYKPLFTVWMWTGCRPSELAGLLWDNVDLDRGTITICQQLSRGQWGTPKNGKARVINLVSAASEAIRQIPKNSNHVFTNSVGKPIDEHVSNIFKRACVRAGVPHRRSYNVRHSFASNALNHGVSLAHVSKMLGHSSVLITAQRYLRPVRDVVEEQRQNQLLEQMQ